MDKKKTFDRIPLKLRRSKVIDSDCKLIIALLYSIKCYSKNNELTLSNMFISNELNINKRTLQRRLKFLEEKRFIKTEVIRNEYDYSTRIITLLDNTNDLFIDLDNKQ